MEPERLQTTLPLDGRVALVTGVSRRAGIGYAIALRLAGLGADLFLAHYRAHDEGQPWGADDIEQVLDGVREQRAREGQRVLGAGPNLADPEAPQVLVDEALRACGHLDILVCNHARSGGDGPLGDLTAAMLDAHWAVNTRSCLLLAQAFAAQHDGRPGGRVVLMTSGQALGPMPGEVAYAASKAALAGVTLTLADQLADAGITVNAVNPGPVDTGYLDEELRRRLLPMFPLGRIGEPDDPARLIAWLVTDDGGWVTGQVLSTEGGFARWRTPQLQAGSHMTIRP